MTTIRDDGSAVPRRAATDTASAAAKGASQADHQGGPSSREPTSAKAGTTADESLFSLLKGLGSALRMGLKDRVELLVLELRRARGAVSSLLLLAAISLVLAIGSWLLLVATAVMGLIALDFSWVAALGLLALVHAVGLAVAALRMRRLAQVVGLPGTRRHLTHLLGPGEEDLGDAENSAAARQGSGVTTPAATSSPGAPGVAGVAERR